MAKKASKKKERESTVLNYDALAAIFLQGNAATLKWLQDRGLLDAEKWCSLCDAPARLMPKGKTYVWVCNSRGHNWSESISANSIFHNSHLSLDRALTLTYWYSRDITDMHFLTNESGKPKVKETRHIISRWLLRLRKAVRLSVKRDVVEKGKIGGPGKTVEIVSRNLKGTRIIGMVERLPGCQLGSQRGGELRLIVCSNELDRKTVIRIIKKNVKRETTVITDPSNVFTRLATLGGRPQLWKAQEREPYYKHAVVNATGRGFISDDDREVHTQTIGSTWSVIKKGIVRSGYRERHLDCYLAEQVWRRKLRRSDEDSFQAMLRVLSDIHRRIFRKSPPCQPCDAKPSVLELELGTNPACVVVKTEPVDDYPDCIATPASTCLSLDGVVVKPEVNCKIPEYGASLACGIAQVVSLGASMQHLAAGTDGGSSAGLAPDLPIQTSAGYTTSSATPPTGTNVQFPMPVVQPSVMQCPVPTTAMQLQPFLTSVQPLTVPFNQVMLRSKEEWFFPCQPRVVELQPPFMLCSVAPQMQPSSMHSPHGVT